ncbi:MAG: hypothetical protein ACR2IP_03170 [Solirubrobacteraceae bacterium]
MTRKILIKASIARAAYGVVALLFPKLLFGAVRRGQPEIDVGARYFNRLLGGWDLVVAGVSVAALRNGATRSVLSANLACELTDTVSLVEEVRLRGGVRGGLDRILVAGLAFNLVGYAAWLRALGSLCRERSGGKRSASDDQSTGRAKRRCRCRMPFRRRSSTVNA